jgi:hypothetical protein
MCWLLSWAWGGDVAGKVICAPEKSVSVVFGVTKALPLRCNGKSQMTLCAVVSVDHVHAMYLYRC